MFGDAFPLAQQYVRWLAGPGVARGLLGPREADRLWERHVVNCAVAGALLHPGEHVVDVGSGAGLPGIPLALTRPDCTFVLLEPMARRSTFLAEVLADLGLGPRVTVVRGRAEDHPRDSYDVATARAVAPLDRLAAWCLPLVRPGGRLLALKGDRAEEEAAAVPRLRPRVERIGAGIIDPPTTVVTISRPSPRKESR